MSLFRGVVIAVVLSLSAVACTTVSKPSRYYVLPSLEDGPEVAAASLENDLSVGVLDIRLPAYLDRPQLVGRAGDSELIVTEFSRWGGSLKQGIQRVLAQNLTVLLGSRHVYRRPWARGTDPDRQVGVDIDRFDVDAQGRTRLYAGWHIFNRGGRALIDEGRVRIRLPAVQGEAAQVRARGQALAELAKAIAARLRAGGE